VKQNIGRSRIHQPKWLGRSPGQYGQQGLWYTYYAWYPRPAPSCQSTRLQACPLLADTVKWSHSYVPKALSYYDLSAGSISWSTCPWTRWLWTHSQELKSLQFLIRSRGCFNWNTRDVQNNNIALELPGYFAVVACYVPLNFALRFMVVVDHGAVRGSVNHSAAFKWNKSCFVRWKYSC